MKLNNDYCAQLIALSPLITIHGHIHGLHRVLRGDGGDVRVRVRDGRGVCKR